MTVTHRETFFLPALSRFSYGMLAPYQGDSGTNAEPVVIAYDDSGATTMLAIDKYFPGIRGERNSRMRLEKASQDPRLFARQYEPILTHILAHEREDGHPYVFLQLFLEVWPRSPLGYEALRIKPQRYFITQVQ